MASGGKISQKAQHSIKTLGLDTLDTIASFNPWAPEIVAKN